jgi:uncharacterized protein (DUF305 family)
MLFSRSFIRKRAISFATTASIAALSFAFAQGSTSAENMPDMRVQHAADQTSDHNETPFLSENDAAMKKMMADMMVRPSGDIDRDFVAMMVPHHQGAVDMAKAELKYGHNKQLRHLAEEIVSNQQQEIGLMRRAVGDEDPVSAKQ